MIKNLKEWILNFINGFCMALADSVPGVSGGTVAFILGFYDKFIGSLDSLFRGKMEEKKSALLFLIKLGIGWACGFIIAALVLGSIFNEQIYNISSLFIGFIIFAIPIVIYEEREALKKNYLNVLFALIGIAFVVAITLLNPASGQGISVHVDNLSIGLIAYVFFAAMIAISAMVLPGISGSTLLLIFGLYVPIMSAVKEFLHMNFSYFPILCVFGLGVITGIVLFVGLIRKALEKFRPQTIYVIIGMMIGSLFSIVMGPTTLEVPQAAMSFNTFNILFFIIGGVIIIGLQAFKMFLNKEN
ncbi:MAG: DUF368 domain-containing protein [Clostridium sp.]|nr:DUF368 domain-containing protein [Clostridium sp.]